MNSEIERIREALRGKRLSVLATELGVPMPTLEQFVSGSARLAPELLAALAKVPESSNPNPSAPSKNIPAPVPRKPDMKLSARSLKVTAVPDPAGLRDPGNSSRVMLEIAVGGRTFTADIAAKSARKCRATIAEHGPEKCVLLIQGRLEGNAIAKAGIVVQVKTPRPEANERPDHTLTPNKGE
jgi:hypothetical protein